MVLSSSANIFEFWSSIRLFYTKYSTNHMVEEAGRKMLRKADKKKNKIYSGERIITQENNFI